MNVLLDTNILIYYHLNIPTNISKAQNIVGYAPTHTIYEGMEEAIEWYIENIGKK